jgi:hypothetical protein
MTTLRVKRIYLEGGLKEGATIELDASDYPLEPVWGWPASAGGVTDAKPTLSPDMIVFLAQRTENQAPGPPWDIVPSGLRIFVEGKVHRFVQESNPGLYGPTPGEAASAGATPFDLAGFEGELTRAIDRAKATNTNTHPRTADDKAWVRMHHRWRMRRR